MTSVGTEEAQIPDLQKQRNSVLTVRLSLSFVLVCVCVRQRSYKQTEQLRENSYGTLTDTPELLHASYLKDIYSQVCVEEEVCCRSLLR